MSLVFAVDRLYDCGYVPSQRRLLQRLDDGRRYPATPDILREFTAHGLTLRMKFITLFNCYRAEWSPLSDNSASIGHGYCVGSTEAEAAVYALAQLLAASAELAV
jgi:hypothetical protein